MSTEAIYLYCFARPGAARDIAAEGVDGRPVIRLNHGSVAALYSVVVAEDFSAAAPGNRMDDTKWVIASACQHERVIEEAMEAGPVVPVRFGTLFSSMDALRLLMVQQGTPIAGTLNALGDKQEWSVKGFVDPVTARAWLIVADPALAEAWRRLPESPGARYFQEKRVHAQAHEAFARWRAIVAEEVREHLGPCAVAATLLDLQDRRVSGREADMVLNVALLVERDRVAEMRTLVKAAATAYTGAGLTLDVSGPWPPYNFCAPPTAES